MFRKKIPLGRIIHPFFCKSSESGRFFIYLHDSNSFFGPGELITKILILIPEATAGNISSFHRTSCFHGDSNKRLHQLQERTPVPAIVEKTELSFVTVTALSMVEQSRGRQQNFELR